MTSGTFRALVANHRGGEYSADLTQLAEADLPAGDVLIANSYSSLNYKDALAVSGQGKICRQLPMVCGIDLAGVVVDSHVPRFRPGDAVVATGGGLSETRWGGFAERTRVPADLVVRLPDGCDPLTAMTLGTAGFTAMLCVQALEDHGLAPTAGPVLVTGATGGVGSVAVMLLSQLGFAVHAVTGRPQDNQDYLQFLGATEILDRSEFARTSKPLESQQFAGGVDCVGGETLATLLAQTQYGGTVAACGLAGSAELPTTVMPFILRGVTLAGIDSVNTPLPRREHAWQRLSDLVDRERLPRLRTVEPIERVPELARRLLSGEIRGRVVIDVNSASDAPAVT